ncbi:MAG: Na+/H+ antiporter NhaC family protein [Emergencia timonensis]|uniref:Na+/H+ antiporter NhaC family protein n=1 Tax=Emergencia timonensis TaxID=1776384 RepID=UPI0009EEDE76|nr:Na+/H+ antiporter NhaC family protein [Emergencia timonensis]WNX86829.1 Na+/H+ antiporter NhaC family protein [Emergencia timonensis]
MDYGIISLLPAVIAIGLAIATRQVVISLLTGVFVGALIIDNGNVVNAFMDTFATYVTGAITDASHASILIFTLTIAGMVAILNLTGGTSAIAASLSKRVKSSRGAQVITSLIGCLVFFDDYANILIVGPTMQPLCDRLHVSREKLTYIVHTTAGIVAGIALMTTWIGFEIGLVTDAFSNMGYENVNGFMMIVKNISYMFYNIMAIIISFAVALMMRDFGPMYKAERAARLGKKLEPGDSSKNVAEDNTVEIGENGKVWYALVPILTMVLTIFFGIWYSGAKSLGSDVDPFTLTGFRDCIGEADPMPPIVWAAMLSTLVASVIAKIFVKVPIKKVYSTWLSGFFGLCEVGIVIVIAWSLGMVITDLHTADFLVGIVSDGVAVGVLPACVFLISCIISFCSGTSWGTMPIVFPIAIPLVAAFVEDPANSHLVIATIAAVLSGSTFGDQTSPISDSSILSSATSGCDVISHVKTQIPYALVPASIAFIGYLLIGFMDIGALLPLIGGAAVVLLIVRFVGKSTDPKDLLESEQR